MNVLKGVNCGRGYSTVMMEGGQWETTLDDIRMSMYKVIGLSLFTFILLFADSLELPRTIFE